MKQLTLICALLLLTVSASAQHLQKANAPTSKLDPPLTSEQIEIAMVQVKHEGYVHRVLVSFDQFMGAVIGLQNDQTISSATEIAAHQDVWYKPFAVTLNVGLDLIQKSHGQRAQAGDLERTQLLIATDASALTAETGIKVIPTIGGAELVGPHGTLKVNNGSTENKCSQ